MKLTESRLRNIIREELQKQLGFYDADEYVIRTLKDELEIRGVGVVEEGRFISLDSKDASGRIIELESDERRGTIRAKLTVSGLPRTLASNYEVTGTTPEEVAKKIKYHMKQEGKY